MEKFLLLFCLIYAIADTNCRLLIFWIYVSSFWNIFPSFWFRSTFLSIETYTMEYTGIFTSNILTDCVYENNYYMDPPPAAYITNSTNSLRATECSMHYNQKACQFEEPHMSAGRPTFYHRDKSTVSPTVSSTGKCKHFDVYIFWLYRIRKWYFNVTQ